MENKERKISDIHNELSKMLISLENQSKQKKALHSVERDLLSSLLRLGYSLLSYYIYLVSQHLKRCPRPKDGFGDPMRNKGQGKRIYRSVFGLLELHRTKYWSKQGKTYYLLDEYLGLGCSRYSYLLDDWLGYSCVEMDFDQGVKLLNRILDQDLSAMQARRRTYHLSTQVEPYYDGVEKECSEEMTHLCVGFDGKGVPIRRSETHRKQESTVSRLGKGKKKDVKREATLSLSSVFTAKPRKVEQVLQGLFACSVGQEKQTEQEQHKWHCAKHIRAFLSDKPRAIDYGLTEVLSRSNSQDKPIIILIDGAPSLENTIKNWVAEHQMEKRVDAYILDFFHLLEYVWKVANAYLGEKHPNREKWVKKQARMLLNSKTQQVLTQWNRILKTQKLSTYKQTLLKRSIKYLSNRPHMVDYKTYLEKGYPITTGAVESACGHFIKSRMERNAMHWSKQGAQQMLDLRAVKKNQDWDNYLKFFIRNEQQKLYPNRAA